MQVYYIEPKKRQYVYTIDDVTHTDLSDEYIDNLEITEEDKIKIKHEIKRHFNLLSFYERQWRNKILELTDWLMVEDATFNGVEVRETEKFAEIKAYRKALREYDFINEDRPARPSWLKI
jgi:hypothetical protein